LSGFLCKIKSKYTLVKPCEKVEKKNEHYTDILPSRKFVFPIRQLMRTLFR